jgi:hypothetical protein
MRANPMTGTSSYVQGYAPAVEFKDKGQVFATGQRTCTPMRCYTNVLVIEEWNAFAPAEGHQLKYHAPGVGIVKIGSLNSSDQEVLNLTSRTRLGSSAMDAVRAEALRLDRRGYQVAPAEYGTTSPAVPLGNAQGPMSVSPPSTNASVRPVAPPLGSRPAATLAARSTTTVPPPTSTVASTKPNHKQRLPRPQGDRRTSFG